MPANSSEAFEVGRSRGDDHANYALAYEDAGGRTISDKPTEIPAYYAEHRADFERGWKSGVKAARARDAALG